VQSDKNNKELSKPAAKPAITGKSSSAPAATVPNGSTHTNAAKAGSKPHTVKPQGIKLPPKVASILISHAASPEGAAPYQQISQTWGIKLDFANFIEIAGVATPEFRKQNVHPLDYSAVIFTSKHAVDHFFRICKDLRIEMPAEAKYFCVTDATAKYLQKYITIRKRKLFVGERTTADLVALVKKHASDKFLFPTGESAKSDLTDHMLANGYHVKDCMVYQTVFCDLTKLKVADYEMICLFSPTSVQSLFHSYPKYQQKKTVIAVFGKGTAKAATEAGLNIDIEVPQPEIPSMAMAIEHFLKA